MIIITIIIILNTCSFQKVCFVPSYRGPKKKEIHIVTTVLSLHTTAPECETEAYVLIVTHTYTHIHTHTLPPFVGSVPYPSGVS
jgi:hypothetical protein